MILNEIEYQNTIEQIKKRERHIADLKKNYIENGYTPEQIKRLIDPMECFLLDLKGEAEEYEQLKRGELGEFGDLRQLGKFLVKLRIAKGLTQVQFSRRLGVSKSIVSRDEYNEYHGITIERATRIIEVLNGKFLGHLNLSHETPNLATKRTSRRLLGKQVKT